MSTHATRLESRLDELSASVAELEARLTRVEEHLEVPRGTPSAEAPIAGSATPAAELDGGADFTTVVALAGRSLLCLAGAYVPRALTGEGLLPQALGVAAGLAYAGLWIFMAD